MDKRKLTRKIKDYNKLRKYMAEFHDAKVAKIFDVSRERVRQLRKRYNINTPKVKQICSLSSYSESEIAQVLKMLNKGMGLWEMESIIGRSKQSIRQMLQKHGIKATSYSLNRKKTIHPNAKTEELGKAKELYRQGYNLFQIQKMLDVSVSLPYIWKKRGHFDGITQGRI